MTDPKQSSAARFSDDQLIAFHQEFKDHLKTEEEESRQQQAIHTALFQKEDKDANIPPGLVQLCARMASDIQDMKIANDRQKRFVGGVMFAFSCIGFLFTDSAHKVLAWLKGL